MNRPPSTHLGAALAGLVVSIVACMEAPFEHVNRLDAASDGTYAIIGAPDTLRSRLLTYRLELQADPPLPAGLRYGWRVNSDAIVTPFDDSQIRGLATLVPTTGTVSALLGARVVTREFVVLQRIGLLSFDCLSGPCNSITSLDQPFSFQLTGLDDAGDQLRGLEVGLSRAIVTSRTPGLVERVGTDGPGTLRLFSRAQGSGWVVVTIDGVSDSVHVVVNQRAVTWANSCPDVPVGTTLVMTAIDQRDANDRPLTTPDAGITWTGANNGDGGQAIVSADGSVTGVQPGTWTVRSANPGITGLQPVCTVNIVP